MIKFKRSLSVKVVYLNCIVKTGCHYNGGWQEREMWAIKSGVFPNVLLERCRYSAAYVKKCINVDALINDDRKFSNEKIIQSKIKFIKDCGCFCNAVCVYI